MIVGLCDFVEPKILLSLLYDDFLYILFWLEDSRRQRNITELLKHLEILGLQCNTCWEVRSVAKLGSLKIVLQYWKWAQYKLDKSECIDMRSNHQMERNTDFRTFGSLLKISLLTLNMGNFHYFICWMEGGGGGRGWSWLLSIVRCTGEIILGC